MNRFAALATARVPVSSLDAATRGDRASSGRYRDIMRPAGLGDELRAALTTGRDCWGYLCLHRTDHPLGFTAAEAALVARVGPHIATCCARRCCCTGHLGRRTIGGPACCSSPTT